MNNMRAEGGGNLELRNYFLSWELVFSLFFSLLSNTISGRIPVRIELAALSYDMGALVLLNLLISKAIHL